MNRVAVIGAGRLGTTLGHALLKKGYTITALSCRSLSSAEKSTQIIGKGIPVTDNKEATIKADIVAITVPDDRIKYVVNELRPIDLNQKFIFHCSGILSSEILKPLKKSGAVTACIHPIQSFSVKSRNPMLFKDIYFSVEGDKKAQQLANKIIKKLGGTGFSIDPKDKPLYHTACTMASNYLVVLLELAENLLGKAGVKKEIQNRMLLPLVKGTLNNISKNGIPGSLTGPISRGDIKTLKSHLNCLKNHPSFLRIYQDLAQQALEIAKKENRLPQKKITEIKALLE
ncbi:MAG TPA: Rossmann-like and DUF2520 domain-containing protein [Acidobacteriota bacterium]|nr:Rossmann-like and DUF2520 domain-containing protein [Acidobacteriota bacterium]